MAKEDDELSKRIKANLRTSGGKEWRIGQLMKPTAEFKKHWAKEKATFTAEERMRRMKKGKATADSIEQRDRKARAAANEKKRKARTARNNLSNKPSLRNPP